MSYGGASTSTQHLHQSLRWFFGIAAVVTDLGHVLLVDLCLDDLSGSQSEVEASSEQLCYKLILGWKCLIYVAPNIFEPLLPVHSPAGSDQVSSRHPQAQGGVHQGGSTYLFSTEWAQWSWSHGAAVHLQN